MCRFASLVLTKDGEFWSDSESHEDIIEGNNLRALDNYAINLVRVELLPKIGEEREMSCWEFIVDQDRFPDWTFKGDPALESRARNALKRRAKEQLWFKTMEDKIAVVGYCGKAFSEDYGIAKAGIGGKATVGDYSIASVESFGDAYVERHSVALAGHSSTVKVGYDCVAKALDNVTMHLGDHGVAVVGHNSSVITGGYCTVSASSGADIITGYRCMVSTGDRSTVVANHNSIVVVGAYSKVFVNGGGGQAIAGAHGQASVGEQGIAVVGFNGWARAGVGGVICISDRESIMTAIVDSVKVMPDVFYCMLAGGLCRVDPENG